jgi:hypothetical protein
MDASESAATKDRKFYRVNEARRTETATASWCRPSASSAFVWTQLCTDKPEYYYFCHAADGSAAAEWRTVDADGNYPPPPLNGIAHTWHHPIDVLDSTIVSGGVEFGGLMPGFGQVLGENDRLAIIAWFQSLWNDDIY